ncbi:Precorrin-6Y C(5,15)-methyltransferase [decarboxylating] [Pseudovibrio axinellae]|uniref:Precorrin-6Y C(5,15)-methyltransferase [decarboxylating] n=1 Tax=Pseudovibrio axinellae TaxID=989403 RepID=A0A165YVH0_9HYPH|nr:bifunctional cobalt-precorrin-7 (C(5))-methyltransferase/cobalt-precorrin-6B (C(15))-methyltransferase [Pseudovibrio axinellae]KZL19271.1 Precorrin-6Y C(5,15)-methyltransferase [decarboxylating] [Pseudovibrio axinellae]SEQ43407.1 precorrin-6Y C5,15-methyltransferase (decarboxylating) [Pseudovibrio axinellae]
MTDRPAPWLTIIGIGEDGYDGLSEAAQCALSSATLVYGGARHLELVEGKLANTSCQLKAWPSPFAKGIEELAANEGQNTVVLATGDPQWFGIGATLHRRFSADEIEVIPHLSAFSMAASRLGWPLQNVETLSLHGRPIDVLRGFLFPGARIIALTSNGAAPGEIADLLADEGYGISTLTVLEHLGGAKERISTCEAEVYSADAADLNTVAIEARSIGNTPVLSRSPGLPDSAFRHDGKITKQEVRAVTLAKLAPVPGQLLWDIGAGSGSIGIEWLRAAKNTKAVAVEPLEKRRVFLRGNAAALGTPDLKVVEGKAPEALTNLPHPDAIFIGGGLTSKDIVKTCFDALPSGGRLVANAVTLEGEQVLAESWKKFGGDLVRLSISRADPIGGLTGWRPLMPVTQWSLVKP